jgi:hypothetical protein
MNKENEKEYVAQYVLLDELLQRIKNSKKIDDTERYVEMFIEVYMNTIGGVE